ncbi:MAG: threonine synthase [Candidatus Aenigmatarchaeota archaeon]|nr:MAG: threonine synthase [Candidatus Aenigmarchaeota archaeon]
MFASYQSCFSCKARYRANERVFRCERCKGSLLLVYDRLPQRKAVRSKAFALTRPHHWKYWMFYPVRRERAITMEEGGTPLLQSKTHNLWFKYEGENPTGSFKDRGSTVEITHAKELGVSRVLCASTGNMGASVAAYASRAHMQAEIWLPKGTPPVKTRQIKAYGGRVVRYGRTYNETLEKTFELAKRAYLAGDYAYRLEGQKSVAFEIADQLKWRVPDYVVVPVGMGTLAFATYKAFAELEALGLTSRMPRLVAVQAAGCAPVVQAFEKNSHMIIQVNNPRTIASAINCGYPNYGHEVLRALRKTKGLAVAVTDKEIIAAQRALGKEGIFAEPGGAASYAGFLKAGLKGSVVCVVTGSGLKDPFAGAKRRSK